MNDVLDFIAKYILLPLISALITLAYRMHSGHDVRLTALETRSVVTEKDVIEIRTALHKDIQYLAKDVAEIKEILKSSN